MVNGDNPEGKKTSELLAGTPYAMEEHAVLPLPEKLAATLRTEMKAQDIKALRETGLPQSQEQAASLLELVPETVKKTLESPGSKITARFVEQMTVTVEPAAVSR
jgi:predicted DNA-binding protein (UPF0251 family)